jgi:glucosamine kinase
MRVVLGIDGGGTKTRAALVSEVGELLGLGIAGPSNYNNVGIRTAQENLGDAVQRAWENGSLHAQSVEAIFLGMAGAISHLDRATFRDMALALDVVQESKILVDHDIRIALAGGLAGKPGIVLIVGTGSSCYGRNTSGEECRVGGWGDLLDDVGSSYYLGLHAMIAITRSEDGRMPPTVLTKAILNRLGLSNIQHITHRIYQESLSRGEIAGLAPFVLEAAAMGDHVAKKIINNGIDELVLLVKTAVERLGLASGETSVTITGGLAQSGLGFKERLYASLRSSIPQIKIIEPILSPVLGAALLALESIGVPSSPEIVRQLSAYSQIDVQYNAV